jgi:NADH-quinone oxidoreductase subunit N
MYFDDATDQSPLVAGVDAKFVLSINCLLLLVLGFMPDRLMNLLSDAVSQSFTSLPF